MTTPEATIRNTLGGYGQLEDALPALERLIAQRDRAREDRDWYRDRLAETMERLVEAERERERVP